eukprot:CAMPEP_0169330714 /NCGR_PEP_ID=MMETSP1017-20121227/13790_1 /TAXON_ID=342587 /ORGANISM="Karlodinium micrum, Strain CCMP2283" /LENGTH=189 /DNA_ID=CAMNT_0009425721 /DNA_START=388 /DNA_END=954 /DNA_ORIENTATION=+
MSRGCRYGLARQSFFGRVYDSQCGRDGVPEQRESPESLEADLTSDLEADDAIGESTTIMRDWNGGLWNRTERRSWVFVSGCSRRERQDCEAQLSIDSRPHCLDCCNFYYLTCDLTRLEWQRESVRGSFQVIRRITINPLEFTSCCSGTLIAMMRSSSSLGCLKERGLFKLGKLAACAPLATVTIRRMLV